ncbi:AI-2E family transporter [Xylanimonas ulmi]|uniref:Putative PurR-regulated permease PerM n=1 Tax=Xylanimonas ulmi TaxID=228973 RepID=A0A4Q7LYH5_9MICO|nr:AI-2E family transporter [Xylanibacterium ulmi]RZS59874.1 putative PurR-regulated permease PerM [Xylanibacterium ulmi]
MSAGPSLSGAESVPPAVRAAAAWSWRLLLIGALVAGVLWLVSQLQTIVVPVAVALLVAVLLRPFRDGLERRARLPRGLATAVSVVGLLALVAALVSLAGRQIVAGFSDLADQAVAGVNEVREWLAHGPLGIGNDQLNAYWEQISDALTSGDGTSTIVTGALGAATTAGHVLVGALIALFCTIFFLIDGRGIWTWLVNLLPVTARERVHQAGRRGIVTLSAYVRTQVLVAFVDAVGIGVGAAFFVPALALPLGILVFVGSFVPIVGAIVTGAIACVVVLVAQGWVAALIMLAIVLAVQQIEGHVLQPFLMGHAVSLHPVAVVLVVAAGSLAAGIVGALFSVPLVAVLNTVILYLHGTDKFPALGTDDHVPLLRRRPSLPAISLPGRTGLRWTARGGDAVAQGESAGVHSAGGEGAEAESAEAESAGDESAGDEDARGVRRSSGADR